MPSARHQTHIETDGIHTHRPRPMRLIQPSQHDTRTEAAPHVQEAAANARDDHEPLGPLEHGLWDGGVDADEGGHQHAIREHGFWDGGVDADEGGHQTLTRVRPRNRHAMREAFSGHQWPSVAIRSHLLGFVNAMSTRVASRTCHRAQSVVISGHQWHSGPTCSGSSTRRLAHLPSRGRSVTISGK